MWVSTAARRSSAIRRVSALHSSHMVTAAGSAHSFSALTRGSPRSFCDASSASTDSTKYSFTNPRLSAAQLGHAPRVPRKYTHVAVDKQPDGFRITLDDKPVKTPKGKIFAVPSEALAQRVAEEWMAQKEHIIPDSMPMMTIACTAIDVIGADVDACVQRLMPYLETDTICYIGDVSIEDAWEKALALEQDSVWTPVRKWFEGVYGPVGVSTGLDPPGHPQETMHKVRTEIGSKSIWDLAALEVSTRYTKSLICATRYLDDDISAEEAMKWALLEENFQIERCGLVEGEHDVQREDMLRWLQAAKEFHRYFLSR